MNWYKNHIVYAKTTLTNSTYMNSYKRVGWNSKKNPSLKKMKVPPLAPGIKESVDKCTKKNPVQSQK